MGVCHELKCYNAVQSVIDPMPNLTKDTNSLESSLATTPYKSAISDSVIGLSQFVVDNYNLNQAAKHKKLLDSKIDESRVNECITTFNNVSSATKEMEKEINQMSQRVLFLNKNKEAYKSLYGCKNENECNNILATIFADYKSEGSTSADTAELNLLGRITNTSENNSQEANQCSMVAREIKNKIIENKALLDKLMQSLPKDLGVLDILNKIMSLGNGSTVVINNREIFFLDKIINKQVKVGSEPKCLQVLDLMSKQAIINNKQINSEIKELPNVINKLNEMKNKSNCKNFSYSNLDCRKSISESMQVITAFSPKDKESDLINKKMIELAK